MSLQTFSAPDKSEPLLVPDNTAEKQGPPPICRVSGETDAEGRIMLRVKHEPGALRAVLGARIDTENVEPCEFAAETIQHLVNLALGGRTPERGAAIPAQALNALLQAVAAFEPADEVEGMMAVQAAAFHLVTMESLSRAQRCERAELRGANLSQANKSARTFAALVETLGRHRGKTTTQRVIVENVTVQAGGQAVVGAVAGAGSRSKRRVQAHANTNGGASGAGEGASRNALRGADAVGEILPPSGGDGPQALPNAWRGGGQRSAEGQSQSMGSRSLHGRSDRDAADGPGADAQRQSADRVTKCERQDTPATFAEPI